LQAQFFNGVNFLLALDDVDKITSDGNRRLAQWRVKWLIEHSTSHQILWCIESLVLRNARHRQAPKR